MRRCWLSRTGGGIDARAGGRRKRRLNRPTGSSGPSRRLFWRSLGAQQHASAPFGWIRDLAEWELRVREVVARIGARSPERINHLETWSGQSAPDPRDAPPQVIAGDRYADFLNYLAWDVQRRREFAAMQIATAIGPQEGHV